LESEKGNLASYREKWRRKVWCGTRQTCRYYSIPFFEVLKAWVLNKQIDGIPLSRPECNNSQDFRDAGDLLNSVAFYIIVKTSQNSTFFLALTRHTTPIQ
jgi:hypothetical protein